MVELAADEGAIHTGSQRAGSRARMLVDSSVKTPHAWAFRRDQLRNESLFGPNVDPVRGSRTSIGAGVTLTGAKPMTTSERLL